MKYHGVKITHDERRALGVQPKKAPNKESPVSRRPKNWILKALRSVVTAGNIIFCMYTASVISNLRRSRGYMSDEAVGHLAVLLLLLLNILLIWSPIREFSNYFSLKMRRRALEEQRKIDELEIVELDDPV